MRLLAITCLCGAISVVDCTKAAGPVIVLDHWWNTDYAKNGCGLMLPKGFDDPGLEACQERRAAALRDFELVLSTQLAARPECVDVRVLGFQLAAVSPEVEKAVSGEHWQLSLNYATENSMIQPWQMYRSPKGTVQQGEGTPQQIASDVCSIVRKRGATVSD
jgi:hypothetical protein